MLLPVLLLLTFLFFKFFQNRRKFANFYRIRQKCVAEFEKISGLPSVPILGSTFYFERKNPMEGRRAADLRQMGFAAEHDGYGVTKIWIGPVPHALVVRGETAKLIFDSSINTYKPTSYRKLQEWIGEGLLTSSGEKWRSRRKLLTQTFHFKVLQQYQKVFVAQGKILVDVLQLRANGQIAFDILPYLKRCAFDIICETAMGVPIGSQRGANSEYLRSVDRLTELVSAYQYYPLNWFKPFWYLTGKGFEFDRHVKSSSELTKKVIEERKKIPIDMEGKLAFLDLLLQEKSLSDEDIREEVETFMLAGHETTAMASNFTIWFLGQHPKYQKKVHEELDEVFGEDFDREPTTEELKSLVFLDQCIKETMRVISIAPFISRELIEDVIVPHPTKEPLILPAGLQVTINLNVIMKDAKHFERPMEFYPAHFDPDRTAARPPFAYIPFAAGPRNCIGQKYAMNELKSTLSWVFRRFSVESVTRYPDEVPVVAITSRPINGTMVVLKNRRKL